MAAKKKLVIVESPAKGATIQKYLGPDFIVKACFGHVVDLAKGGKNGIGIDLDNNFKAKYVIMDNKFAVLDEIINLVDECSEIYLASDPDREGEAISYHLSTRLETCRKPIFRSEFHLITKDEVQKAIKNPREIDMNLFHAQEARRILDRIVGFLVSPFLINSFGQNLSAGRVQSVAVKMIADREGEIEEFKPQEYWNVSAFFKQLSSDEAFFSTKFDGKFSSKQECELLKTQLLEPDTKFIVSKVISKEKKDPPKPPMITAKLQQIMAKKFSFDNERTMKAAQSLYEAGYCTYIRTDSTRISEDAVKSIRDYLTTNNYQIPSKPNEYKTSDSAQDAHECIRPADINVKPGSVPMTSDEKSVYKVIWEYCVASQMLPAVFSTLEIKILNSKNKNVIFKASGKALKSKGYLDILGNYSDDQGTAKIDIPLLVENQEVFLKEGNSIFYEQKFTQPPARYTVASFTEALETKGIGRPATYAQIVKTITSRAYVEQKGQGYHATPLGRKITDTLEKYFPFMQYNYTANMEKQLDQIAAGKLKQFDMISSFYKPFSTQLKSAYSDFNAKLCDKCTSPMVLRKNSKNDTEFYACSAFPKCKNTVSK